MCKVVGYIYVGLVFLCDSHWCDKSEWCVMASFHLFSKWRLDMYKLEFMNFFFHFVFSSRWESIVINYKFPRANIFLLFLKTWNIVYCMTLWVLKHSVKINITCLFSWILETCYHYYYHYCYYYYWYWYILLLLWLLLLLLLLLSSLSLLLLLWKALSWSRKPLK